MNIIDRVLIAEIPEDLTADLHQFPDYYKKAIAQIHPDVNSTTEAHNASQKINTWYNDSKQSKQINHDLETLSYSWFEFTFSNTGPALQHSNTLLNQFKANPQLAPYFPKNTTTFFHNRCVPLTALPRPLPIEHVNWVVSRMLEACMYINKQQYVHAGFTPTNIFVCPANHSIQIMSSIHSTPQNERLKTISGAYKHLYPQASLQTKIATPTLDLQMIKYLGLMLLGDSSGIGTRFRKELHIIPPSLLAFYQQVDEDPSTCYITYRDLLKKLFPKKFFKLIF